ncbi:hypothetical protein HKD37_16G044542 [Glycine soja]
MKLGMEFNSLVDFKDAMRKYSILTGREVRFPKNEKIRVRVVCKSKGCSFKALVNQVENQTTFRMKTFEGEHTCGKVFNNKTANSKWLAKKVAGKLLTTKKKWPTLPESLQLELGEQKNGYNDELISDLKQNACKVNAEHISLTLLPRFESSCQKGFVVRCRSFIGVDGFHLKTKYGGILLIVVERDPNDQYYPITYVVVESETKKPWRWVPTLLLEDIRLVNVFQEMFENVEHKLHVSLYANFKKQFGGETLIRYLMMGATETIYYQEFEKKNTWN